MNFLAHAFLSFDHPELLAGNMNGDFVKGLRALQDYPVGVQQGIMLHRFIDSYTDAHPAISRAKVLFRPTYHLYAGPILDCLMDYYLANDPRYFSGEEKLKEFTQSTYASLDEHQELLHPNFIRLFSYMRTEDWLYKYRTLPGIKRSLEGIARRAPHMPSPEEAYEIFITHYYHINQCYFELIDDVCKAVKKHLTELKPVVEGLNLRLYP